MSGIEAKPLVPDELPDKKIECESLASKAIEILEKHISELESWKSKVETNEEDKAKLEQFEIVSDLAKSKTSIKDMSDLLKTMRSAKLQSFFAAKNDIDQKICDMSTIGAVLQSYTRACKRYFSVRSAAQKATKGRQGYQESKRCRHFVEAGSGRKRSVLGSMLMHYGEQTADQWPEFILKPQSAQSISFDAVTAWQEKSDPISACLVDPCRTEIDNAEAKVVASMGKKANASQRGMFRQVEEPLSEKLKLSELPQCISLHPAHKIEGEFAPFVACVRRYTLRVGVSSWPMVGFGCFVYALSGPIYMAVVDVTLLINKTELQLLDQFDDMLAAKALREHVWPCCILKKGEVAWVPYGSLPLVCGPEELNTFAILPWVSSALYKSAAHVAESGTEFLCAAMTAQAKRHPDAQPWNIIAGPLSEFFAANKAE